MKYPSIFLVVCVLLFSCSKKIVPTVVPPTPVLEIEEINFEYFQGKAKMVLRNDNKEQEVKAHIRIRKDSVIWMTLTAAGVVQAGRALINKDSITVISTVEKEYFVFSYEELSKKFNFDVNYNTIQSAILGNLISPREEKDKIEQGPSFNILEQQRGTTHIRNYINAASRKLEKVEMKEATTNNSVTVNYSDFQPVGDRIYPFHGVIDIIYKSSKGLLNTSIALEYNKAEVGDKELKFPFNIPRKYDRR